ncbi:MAG: hypothetical protein ACXACX_09270 [Candidatus Hodarchaeales archaeon]|jgi:hypothetical protein
METINWLSYVAMAITGVLVPLAVELLKKYWPKAPTWLKSVGSLIFGGLILTLGTFLSNWLGVPIDLSEIASIFTGGVLGLTATAAYSFGKKNRG